MTDIVIDGVPALTAVSPPTPTPPEPEEPLVQVEGFTASFMKEAVKIILPTGESKLLSYQDAVPVFREFFISKEDDGSKAKTLLLPPNVYTIEESSTHMKLGMYFPEGKQMIHYTGHGKPRLSVTPNIVIQVTLRKNGQDFEIQSSKYYSTSIPLQEFPRTLSALESRGGKITYVPYTNAYDDFRMCFGDNHMARLFKARDLRELYWYYLFLWNSPFNNDLGIYALRGNDEFSGRYPAWYDHMANLATENQPFPYSEIGI